MGTGSRSPQAQALQSIENSLLICLVQFELGPHQDDFTTLCVMCVYPGGQSLYCGPHRNDFYYFVCHVCVCTLVVKDGIAPALAHPLVVKDDIADPIKTIFTT